MVGKLRGLYRSQVKAGILFKMTAVLLWTYAAPLLAQKNEVGLLAGSDFTPSVSVTGNVPVQFSPSLAFTIEYDHRFLSTHFGSLSGGIDFSASPLDVKTNGGPTNATSQYAYIFLTPHVRWKLPEIKGVVPWFSAGGGFADFDEAKLRNSLPNPNSGTKTAAGEISGGVDIPTKIHIKLPLVLRGEVRDYISGTPNYNVPTGTKQNNVVVSGGFVLRF